MSPAWIARVKIISFELIKIYFWHFTDGAPYLIT